MQGSLSKICIRDENKTYHKGKKKLISKEKLNTYILCPFSTAKPHVTVLLYLPQITPKRTEIAVSIQLVTNPCKARENTILVQQRGAEHPADQHIANARAGAARSAGPAVAHRACRDSAWRGLCCWAHVEHQQRCLSP